MHYSRKMKHEQDSMSPVSSSVFWADRVCVDRKISLYTPHGPMDRSSQTLFGPIFIELNPSQSVIKRHQASSSIIKCHQASWSVIKRHQVSSSVIKHHQASSSVIKHHQASSSIIKCHKASSKIIKCHQALSCVIKQASSSIIKHFNSVIYCHYCINNENKSG